MTDIDAVDRLLQQARVELAPSLSERARGRAGLGLARKRPAASVRALHAVRPPSGWAGLRASGKVGACVGLLIAAGGFGTGYWAALRGASPSGVLPPGVTAFDTRDVARDVSPVQATAPSTDADRADPGSETGTLAEPSPQPGLTPDRESATKAKKRAPLPRRAPLRRAPERAVGDELSLLRRVERALRAEDPTLALALLRELDAQFPSTALIEERSAADVLARCALAEPGARLRAESFLRDRPTSVYAERVREACQLASARETAEPDEGSGRRGYE